MGALVVVFGIGLVVVGVLIAALAVPRAMGDDRARFERSGAGRYGHKSEYRRR